ncbi:putative membrane protein [Plasmodium gaboni]|uniref:Putative membrane protein n=1 Tax=Plasmodium gaboni TaxID=647221 RepID=A0A151LKQ7_9APIC|nr:putative membrane protein [Plasmodium gaboni]KYN99467.1 putative membrane protein [Plasmodium gaboni]
MIKALYSLVILSVLPLILYIHPLICLYVEDTLKIPLADIKSGDYIKFCCDLFCSFYKYDIFKKTFIFLKKENNITVYNCYGIIKVYYSKKYLFYFSTFINVEQNNIIEIVDSFDKDKISRYVFFTPLFEYTTTKKNNMVYYIPFGYYKFKKLKNETLNHKKTHNNDNNIFSINKQKVNYYTYGQHIQQINKLKEDIYKYKKNRKNNKYIIFIKNSSTYIIPLSFYYNNSMNLKKCIPQLIKYNIHTSNNNINNNNYYYYYNYCYYFCCYYIKKNYILSMGQKKLIFKEFIFNKYKEFQYIIEQNEKNKLILYVNYNMTKKYKTYNNLIDTEIYKFLEILFFNNTHHNPQILYSKYMDIITSHNIKNNNNNINRDIKNYNENKNIELLDNSSNYKDQQTQSMLFLSICLFMFFFLLFIYVIIRGKKNKNNLINKEINNNPYKEKNFKRLAEIHVEYKKKIQTNLGSKIKDITDHDLIKLITYNKAETIVVCQP